MKYIARVNDVLRPGAHRVAQIADGEFVSDAFPAPDRVEIVVEPNGSSCFMYRFTEADTFCGDTWHATLDEAVAQAQFEFGLERSDFLEVIEGARC